MSGQPGFVAEQRGHPRRRHRLGRVGAVGFLPRDWSHASTVGARPASTNVNQLAWTSSAASPRQTGGAQVRDRLVDVTVRPVPLGRALVQLRHAVGVPGLQLAAGDRREQVVEAEPATITVQRDKEQVPPLQLVENLCRTGRVADRVAQRRTEAVEDRHGDDELAHLVRVLAEHLFGEVAGDEPVVRPSATHELVGVRATGQRQAGEVDAGRPPLGLTHEVRAGLALTAGPARRRATLAASSLSKLSWSARISARRPEARRRPSRRPGSARDTMTRCACSGRFSMRNSTCSRQSADCT